jgi:hypothetical protein
MYVGLYNFIFISLKRSNLHHGEVFSLSTLWVTQTVKNTFTSNRSIISINVILTHEPRLPVSTDLSCRFLMFQFADPISLSDAFVVGHSKTYCKKSYACNFVVWHMSVWPKIHLIYGKLGENREWLIKLKIRVPFIHLISANVF